ncbi:MAG: Holliday junction resolvase RuvX [Rhodospirillales bacterium]
MIAERITDLKRLTGGKGALLGLDVGKKTVGVAISDMSWMIASPLVLIRRRKLADDLASLVKLVADNKVVGLVIGMPLNMDGSEGPRAQSTRQFARNIEPAIDLPVFFQDERLSTVAVERVLTGEADLSRAKRAEVVDRAAAAWILQSALDAARLQG